MHNKLQYDRWSSSYDSVVNRTRDLEAKAFRHHLSQIPFKNVIELGAGTGKNTSWLATKSQRVLAVDFSEQMLAIAREKVTDENVEFVTADLTRPWSFPSVKADLICCSLVLEHIEDLEFIFQQAALLLEKDGFFYVGELHPFKQYEGSKARFDTPNGVVTLDCFTHHISYFMAAAINNQFLCHSLDEWFDDGDEKTIPRIIAMIFQKISA